MLVDIPYTLKFAVFRALLVVLLVAIEIGSLASASLFR